MGANSEQQYSLKWNNHRSTIVSVFDSLLEEESLVDVTLSADGQFLRAHRIILSACSPYFKSLFRSTFLQDKAPVIVLKDVNFDNLKALVEYMYKGEANVPQDKLASFIHTAESLQIRGLAEGANSNNNNSSKKFNDSGTGTATPPTGSNANQAASPPTFPLFPPPGHHHQAHSTPMKGLNGRNLKGHMSGGGILAARLAAAAEGGMGASFMDFGPGLMGMGVPPASKKSRKPERPSHKSEILDSLGVIPKERKRAKGLPKLMASNNNTSNASNVAVNSEVEDEGSLKIDEDVDSGKENRKGQGQGQMEDEDEDIVDLGNGMETDDEEEQAMPGPVGSNGEGGNSKLPRRMINPWTGEEMDIPDEHGDGHHMNDGPMLPFLDPATIAAARAAAAAGLDISANGPLSPGRGGSGAGSLNTSSNNGEGSANDGRDPLTNKYSCTRCNRSYLHQATLVRHQRYECGITASYPCSLCGRKFKRRDVLKGHMEKCVNKSAAAAQASAMGAMSAVAALTVGVGEVGAMGGVSPPTSGSPFSAS